MSDEEDGPMTLPGYAAEASLYKTTQLYRGYFSGMSRIDAGASVVPQQTPTWGTLSSSCIPGGTTFSAILWNIPWGWSWTGTCAVTPGTQCPVVGMLPTRCVNTIFNVWGEWDTPVPCSNPFGGCGGGGGGGGGGCPPGTKCCGDTDPKTGRCSGLCARQCP